MIAGFSLARKQPNKIEMKHLLITTIAAVLVVGGGKPNIWAAATTGNIEAAKQHLAKGVDVDAKGENG